MLIRKIRLITKNHMNHSSDKFLTKNVWYLLLHVFDCYYQSLISGRETWHYAMSPSLTWDFPNISLFPKLFGNS